MNIDLDSMSIINLYKISAEKYDTELRECYKSRYNSVVGELDYFCRQARKFEVEQIVKKNYSLTILNLIFDEYYDDYTDSWLEYDFVKYCDELYDEFYDEYDYFLGWFDGANVDI